MTVDDIYERYYQEHSSFNYDLDRMKKSLEQQFIRLPAGLTREERRQYILSFADFIETPKIRLSLL